METILELPEIGFEVTQKFIQQRLTLILHAHGCQLQEFSGNGDIIDNHGKKCKLPFCEETKKNLDHIRCCFDPETCNASHCATNRAIIKHWKSCMKKSFCDICQPIVQAQQKSLKSRSR